MKYFGFIIMTQYVTQDKILIQNLLKYFKPVPNASFDTIYAKMGRWYTPQSTFEFPHEMWF